MTDSYQLPDYAEVSIIGCVIFCPETKPVVSSLISENDFSSPLYGAIFSAAMELEQPDTTVFHELVKKRGFTIPSDFINSLCDFTVDRHNVELYAKLLREDAQRRRLRELAQQMEQDAVHQDDPAEIISRASDRLKEIEHGGPASDIADQKAAWLAFLDHRKMVESGNGAVPTGFAPLDSILGGGMLRSGFYIIAARPGMGKTTVGLQFADCIAANIGPVLFVSLEMSLAQLEGKRLARLSGVPSDEILLGDGKLLNYQKVREAARQLRNSPVFISQLPSATVAYVRRLAKQIEGLQCVFVDYLGKLSAANLRASRYEQVTEISRDLKSLAVELEVPVVALAQLNRENAGRIDKRPQLSDLRDSGAIEQDADGVVMLHREDYYAACDVQELPVQAWESVELELIVRKNRHGRSFGVCKAGFFPATGRIVRVG